ncbi:MAG TPA: alpha/beta fold hydrolase [Solirubrobacteraceae bacterium]|nr:alpha/beta fold hydrolase [Solirubrobacteraceae bacterium]
MGAPDLQVLLGELADLVTAAGGRPRTHAYGPHAEQVADLLLPSGEGEHPVAVLLHGGFWRSRFTRATMAALAVDLVDRGWATWNVEYRRTGTGGGVPETLEDVRAALRALAQLPAPLDRRRVIIIGHSAGGQLGLCVADEPLVSAVVSLAGVCDLEAAHAEGIGEGAAVEFMAAAPAERPDAYRLADPLARIPAGVPVLLVHGDADQRVPVAYSRRYAQAAARAGDGRCELMELAGVDHFALIDPRTQTWAAIFSRLETLVP